MKATAILLVVLLTACAPATVRHQTKGATEYYVDLTACEQGFAAMQDRWSASYAIGRCLASKGWR